MFYKRLTLRCEYFDQVSRTQNMIYLQGNKIVTNRRNKNFPITFFSFLVGLINGLKELKKKLLVFWKKKF